MKWITLVFVSTALVGMASMAQAQNGAQKGSQMQNQGATTGQGEQYNPKNDKAPGNPQVHDATGNAGNTPPNAGGKDAGGRVNSHTQQ